MRSSDGLEGSKKNKLKLWVDKNILLNDIHLEITLKRFWLFPTGYQRWLSFYG